MSKPISEQWAEASYEWVELENAASLLEETKSAVLSQRMSRLGDIPVSKAEATVKASQEWSDHLAKIAQARKLANKAKVKCEYLKMRFWEAQSHAANERLEAKL